MGEIYNFDIRFIDEEEWEEAMSLVYRTFLEFDAPMFTDEGITNFRSFISDNSLKRMFNNGVFQVIGAYYRLKLVGVIALKDNSHISLLFVDRDYHKKGAGRSLMNALLDYAAIKLHTERITVNSSPYAVEFYRKLGFTSVFDEITEAGITYTPMEYLIGV